MRLPRQIWLLVWISAWVHLGCAGGGGGTLRRPEDIIASAAKLETRVRADRATFDLASVSLAVVADQTVILNQGFGVPDNDVRQAASLTKVVSAFAALTLVAEGRLALDEPLSNYTKTPYLPEASHPITLRHVLTHRSGLPNDVTGGDRRVYFTPGERFAYSGGGFRYLQGVLEDVTGMPFQQFMEDTVLPRLGMKRSRMTAEYQGMPFVNAAASLMAPASDLAKLLAELADPSPENAPIVQRMTNPEASLPAHGASSSHKIARSAPHASAPYTQAWGLGIGILTTERDGRILWHWGNNFGLHHTLAMIYADRGLGVVVMATGARGPEALAGIAQAAIGGEHYPFWEAVPRARPAASGP